MRSLRVSTRSSVAAAGVVLALLGASGAAAVEKCKVKIDAAGNLQVSASAVTGTLHWGGAADATTQTFFDSATCVSGGKAKKCLLGDPATVAARTPPAGCTLYLADEAPSACSVWIKGCTPGARDLDDSGRCARVVNGVTIFDGCQ
jgi:hypothetical protein